MCPMPVEYSGPFFDGNMESEIKSFMGDVAKELGQIGVASVKATLRSSLQNPTGAYESGIQAEVQQTDLAVTDGGIVYGPWLDGVGSRNQTTRFKGYSMFRKAYQELESKAQAVADRVFAKHKSKLGG